MTLPLTCTSSEQEYLRIGEPGGYMNAKENQTLNVAEVDAATAREMYVAPFVEGIRAGAGGIMCSYNKINGTLACSNDEVLNKLVRRRFLFPRLYLSAVSASPALSVVR